MKVLLVNPPQEKSALRSTFGITKNRFILPYNLICLASYLNNHDHEAEVLDGVAKQYSIEDIVDYAVQSKPDLVGITSFTMSAPAAFALADALRNRLPELIICYGGIHACVLPKQSLSECLAIDFCIAGEGELPLLRSINSLQGGGSLKDISGVVTRESGEDEKRKPELFSPESWVLPDYNLVDMRLYKPQYGSVKQNH